MREMSIDEMKAVSLNMMLDVADFCDKYNIRYYICGGTLLGAIRHKGYIPWDDDIDIIMPRPDYLRFLKEYNGSNERYVVYGVENNSKYWRTFAKVFDLNTHLQEDNIRCEKPDNGVFIDIFPIDGLPKSRTAQKLLFKEQEFLNFLYHCSAWGYTKSFKYADSKARFAVLKGYIRTYLKYVAVTIFGWLPTYKLIKLINSNASKYGYDEADEVAAIVDCHYGGERERMPKNVFEPRRKFEFEGHQLWGSEGYDLYLSNLYGNYMELPPEDRRVTHHDFKAYWKD